MNALTDLLRRRIHLDGPVTVAYFMTTALLHPQHGYYMRQDPLGADGDFITAPEVSQMFGELIGLWCAATWQQLGAPRGVKLVELGPGRGTLMADALRAAAMAPGFLDAVDIHLVEAGPRLREKQRGALPDFDVTWHDGLETVPEGPLLLIANEFFDALPIRQLECHQGIWHERLVTWADGAFRFFRDPAPSPLAGLLPRDVTARAATGDIFEISPAGVGIAKAISERIGQWGGSALIIDYGHGASAAGETLQALREHQPVEVLAAPGEADLTAHVDFAALARSAAPAAVSHGPVTQSLFLQRLGIEARKAALIANADDAAAAAVESGYHRLVDSAEMGQLFKVMCLTAADAPEPAGFESG